MSRKLDHLEQRRVKLQQDAASHRQVLAGNMRFWHQKLKLVDRALSGVHFLRRHPLLLIAGGGLLAWLKPVGMARIAFGAWAGLQSLRQVRGWLVK
jgi:YqjK-like protein